MADKTGSDSYIAAHEASEQLGNVKVVTEEGKIKPLLSTEAGTNILNKYESGLKDGLTGLLKKDAWWDEAKRFFEYSSRKGSQFGILYIDIDDFKPYNDDISHTFGDEVIKTVAKAIGDSVRDTDIAGRVGGDEFAVGLPDADYTTLKEVRDRVLSKVDEYSKRSESLMAHNVVPTVTIGLHTSIPEDDTFESVYEEADKHMLELKALNNHGR
ncbi:MAG TPA: GGDEF domain-containing protein [Patescibacteria group bacterium]|nr:GGDEF domain-containing protein [Patescibacteria group bacterium]